MWFAFFVQNSFYLILVFSQRKKRNHWFNEKNIHLCNDLIPVKNSFHIHILSRFYIYYSSGYSRTILYNKIFNQSINQSYPYLYIFELIWNGIWKRGPAIYIQGFIRKRNLQETPMWTPQTAARRKKYRPAPALTGPLHPNS